jgi:hypothetical protein
MIWGCTTMESRLLTDIIAIQKTVMPSSSTSRKACVGSSSAARNPSSPPTCVQKKGRMSSDMTTVSMPWKKSFHTAAISPPASA